jgi:cytoskeletal protein CcmA (bactofilin family)
MRWVPSQKDGSVLRKPTRDIQFDRPTAAEGDFSSGDFDLGSARSQFGGSGDSGDGALLENRAQSVIDSNSSFDGRFEAGQDLVVLGSIVGEIACKGLLTIERDATAKAKVESRDAIVRGKLDGDIVCSGRLVIASTAQVSGTVKAAALVVEEGASIRGTVEAAVSGMGESASSSRGAGRKTATGESSDGSAGTGRWSPRTREVPSFALVASEERNAGNS